MFAHLPGRELPPSGWAEQKSTELDARLVQLGRLLEPQPHAGESLQLGDCGYPISFAWMEALCPSLGISINWPDHVSAYRKRLGKIPAVRSELLSYEKALAEFLRV